MITNRYMSTPKKILVIDIEATCWKDKPPNQQLGETQNEIIEIGIAVIDIKAKVLESSRSIMVKNVRTEISDFCTELTTITQEMIDQHGIFFSEACDILKREYKSDRNIFASWGDYDRGAFEKNCRWNNVPYPFQKNIHLNVKTLFAAKFGYNGGQESCARDLGIVMQGTAHRGIDDAVNIAKILLKIL